MSFRTGTSPVCTSCDDAAVELIIEGKEHDIGAFTVRRVLPSRARRAVGPFVFFDHMGPAEIPPGAGMSVRPHPHINLATVTYLFDGAVHHRDSLGCDQVIRPGAVNWMTAGRGIVHSERTPEELAETGSRMHGLQLWLALPEEHEEVEPSFAHHPADSIPEVERDGARLRVLAGQAFGQRSPVEVLSPLFYVAASMSANSKVTLAPEYSERAAYIVTGSVRLGDQEFVAGQMVVLAADCVAVFEAGRDTRMVFIGGEPLGKRHIWWNFVSSSKERLEAAKADWARGPGTDQFPTVPGDDDEFIPLPE